MGIGISVERLYEVEDGNQGEIVYGVSSEQRKQSEACDSERFFRGETVEGLQHAFQDVYVTGRNGSD